MGVRVARRVDKEERKERERERKEGGRKKRDSRHPNTQSLVGEEEESPCTLTAKGFLQC